jgi:hypothetical protein
VADELAGERRLAARTTAQLTDDPLLVSGAPGYAPARAFVQVHVLAGERRAPAVGAAMPVGLEVDHAATQQKALELLDVGD